MALWGSDLGGEGGGTMTGAEILSALLSVDGAGSGLDADFVRGEVIGDMTGAEILSALLAVDGAGSGLDADFVRGEVVGNANFWNEITDFTATPASTSTLTMTSDLTGTIQPGMGLKYTVLSVVYYGMCTAITSSLLTVSGAPLSGDVTDLEYLTIPMIPIAFAVSGYFADSATTTLIKDDITKARSPTWGGYPAHCVFFKISRTSNDTGASTQPTVNLLIDSSALLTTALSLPSVGTVSSQAIVEFDVSNYRISFDDEFDIQIVASTGGTPANDALDLFVEMMFLPEVA